MRKYLCQKYFLQMKYLENILQAFGINIFANEIFGKYFASFWYKGGREEI